MEFLLEQISQITHGVVLNRIKPKILSEGAEYPILTISQLIDEENGVWDYEVPTALVDKKKVKNLNLAKEHSIVIEFCFDRISEWDNGSLLLCMVF